MENERIVGILKHGKISELSQEIRDEFDLKEEGLYNKCMCEYDDMPRKIVYKRSLGRMFDFAKSMCVTDGG